MRFLREHSLSIFLIVVLIIQSTLYGILHFPEWQEEQLMLGDGWSWAGWWRHYWGEWHLSVLADVAGFAMIVLTGKWLYEKGSPEGKPNGKGEDQ